MSGPDEVRELTCDEAREMAGAYVLGALDVADEGAVRAHLATCSLAHDEIEQLGAVIPALVEVVPILEPPEGLKARIMAAAAADLASRGGAARAADAATTPVPTTATASTTAPAPVPTTAPRSVAPPAIESTRAPISFPGAKGRATRRAETSTGGWLVRIAAVLVIAALGGWNLLLQGQLSAAQRYDQNVASVLDMAARPGSLTAILAADGGTGSGLAAVGANGKLALAMRDLVPTSGTVVYETWVIGGDGVPVPVGSFPVGSAGTAYFEGTGLPLSNGTVVALTREPGPGATTPTAPIIAKGVASAPG